MPPPKIIKNRMNEIIITIGKTIKNLFILNERAEIMNPRDKETGYAHIAQDLPPKGTKFKWEKLVNSHNTIKIAPIMIPQMINVKLLNCLIIFYILLNKYFTSSLIILYPS
jgi:hypothetical protein